MWIWHIPSFPRSRHYKYTSVEDDVSTDTLSVSRIFRIQRSCRRRRQRMGHKEDVCHPRRPPRANAPPVCPTPTSSERSIAHLHTITCHDIRPGLITDVGPSTLLLRHVCHFRIRNPQSRCFSFAQRSARRSGMCECEAKFTEETDKVGPLMNKLVIFIFHKSWYALCEFNN